MSERRTSNISDHPPSTQGAKPSLFTGSEGDQLNFDNTRKDIPGELDWSPTSQLNSLNSLDSFPTRKSPSTESSTFRDTSRSLRVPPTALTGPPQRLVIAIDYGTTFTGIAFCTPQPQSVKPILEQIQLVQTWKSGVGNNDKIPSRIFYSPSSTGGQLFDINPDAVAMVRTKFELDVQENRLGELELITKVLKGTDNLSFGNVKALKSHPSYTWKQSEDIVTEYLAKLIQYLENDLYTYNESFPSNMSIDIVITVPLKWSYSAKNSLLHAIQNAGFNKRTFPNLKDLIMVTELESAAIYSARYLKEDFRQGECFVICDAGGGTVDVISYEVARIELNIELKPVTLAMGEKCGATFIDTHFRLWLKEILGEANYHQLDLQDVGQDISSHTGEGQYMRELMEAFEAEKRLFPRHSDDIKIKLPYPLRGLDIPGRVKLGVLIITHNEMHSFFDPCVKRVIELVRGQIRQIERIRRKVKNVILIGGLSESVHLQSELQYGLFDLEVRLCKPKSPWSAVARGATLYGVEKSQHKNIPIIRACPRSYGIILNQSFSEENFSGARHRRRNHQRDTTTNRTMADGQLTWLIRKGDLLLFDEPHQSEKEMTFYFQDPDERRIILPVYTSDDTPDRYETADEELPEIGVLNCDLSDIPLHEFDRHINQETGYSYYSTHLILRKVVTRNTLIIEILWNQTQRRSIETKDFHRIEPKVKSGNVFHPESLKKPISDSYRLSKPTSIQSQHMAKLASLHTNIAPRSREAIARAAISIGEHGKGHEHAVVDTHIITRGELWRNASNSHTYHNVRQLIQDIKDADKMCSTISMKFSCRIPKVLRLADTQLKSDDDLHANKLSNHVVMVKLPTKDEVGHPSRMQAMTCLEYMEDRWEQLGRQLIRDITKLCGTKQEITNTNISSFQNFAQYSLTIDGNILLVNVDSPADDSQLTDLIEALDWLCRAVRDPLPETSDNYVISDSSCKISLNNHEANGGISLEFSLSSKPLPEMAHNCWQRLFHSCFVLEHHTDRFSSPASGKGLEMSLDLMMSLAGIEYSVIVNGGMVFVGYHTALIPIEIHDHYIQFHIEINTDHQINPFTMEYGPRALQTDSTVFKSKRCFLGWCEVAHIKLGTQDLPATVRYSPASEKPKSLHLTGISTGFQATSAFPLQAGITGQATFSFVSHRLRFTPTSVYSKMLLDASKQVALIYDVTAQRSWLVPKLSLLIHMAHIWFKENSPLKGCILDPIPFAEPHDNGKILVEAFQGHGDAVVCGCDNDVLRLRSLLLGFNINLLATASLTERCTDKHIYGFEFMDIILEPGKGAMMKKSKIKKSGNWLAFANLADAVILCSELGEAMAPADVGSRKNSCCNSLPLGNDYLAAHVSCLDELVNRSGRQQLAAQLSSSQIILSQRNLWNISGDPFGACSHDSGSSDTCWNRVNILQKVCDTDFFWAKIGRSKERKRATSTKLSLKGAVVFGESLGKG